MARGNVGYIYLEVFFFTFVLLEAGMAGRVANELQYCGAEDGGYQNVNLFLYLVVTFCAVSRGRTFVADLVIDPEWPELAQPVNYIASAVTDT